MGIVLMENYDVADMATLTAQRTLTVADGGKLQATGFLMDQPSSSVLSYWGVNTFTEKGMRRTGLRMMANFNGNGTVPSGILRIPLPQAVTAAGGPAARSFYASMRLRFLKGTNLSVAEAVPMPVMERPQVYIAAGLYPTYVYNSAFNAFLVTNATVNADGVITKNRLFVGPGTANTVNHADFVGDDDGWFHVEIYKPAGSWTLSVWVNDFPYTASAALQDPNQSNANTMYLNLYMGRTQTLVGNLFYGLEVADTIIIDPTTAGQKYRYGSSGRVLSLDYASDITNQWTADPSATLSHSQMMMVDQSVPAATNILTANTIGQREQYSVKPIPADFGPYLPVVAIKPRVMNGGAASHGLAMEMDWGAGLTEVSTKMVAAGGAYDTTPLIMTTKPNGDPWTTADFASAKAGFSVKS